MSILKNLRLGIVAIALLAFGLASCEIIIPFDDLKPKDPTPLPRTSVTGKVVDAMTLEGIADAKVSVKVNGEWRTATTKAAVATGLSGHLFDTGVGDFVIRGLPGEFSSLPIVVEGPTEGAYILITGALSSSSNEGGGNTMMDIGFVSLDKGLEAFIHVVDKDTAEDIVGDITMIPDYAANTSTTTVNGYYGLDLAKAKRESADDSTYSVTIPNNGNTSRVFIANFDGDGDGIIDHGGAVVSFTASDKAIGLLDKVVVLDDLYASSAVQWTATSLYDNDQSQTAALGAAESIWIYFNQPIEPAPVASEPSKAVAMSFTDDLKALGAETANLLASLKTTVLLAGTGLTVSSAVDGQLLMIDPVANLTENENYALSGIIRGLDQDPYSATNSTQEADLSSVTNGTSALTPIYVHYTGVGDIGDATVDMSLDNKNSCTNGASITSGIGTCTTGGTSSAVSAYFPEPVWGQIDILSTTSGTTTTTLTGGLTTLACTPTSMAFYPAEGTGATTNSNNTSNQGTNVGASACPVALAGVTLVDHLAATPSTVKIYLDVYDSDGNEWVGEYSLNVE